ncbi:MAG: LacI family transcriptional regulator [Lachnospiraceae bacterium]|nr:LacI family transcriptional regulator [Lachnospiraceae bacterium]
MKKKLVATISIIICIFLSGCGILSISVDKDGKEENQTPGRNIVIGFSQLGAESDWRSANTESMKTTFTKAEGYEFIFEDGQQKQANQITAIRKFIQQEVDYIVLAPVTETGWDTVLQEAKNAGIPVIIVDRMIDVDDDSLFTCWVGSNFELEGKKATKWLERYVEINEIKHKDIHIVNIQGTIGASAQIGRTKALRDAADANGWDLIAEVPGDFTQAKAREQMSSLLEQYDNINVVYCENDNEAFGAIEAIEAAGKVVGNNITEGEIMIISFDGVNENAIEFVKNGKIACIAECNPLHGPRVQAIIELLEIGGSPDKLSYVEELFFSADRTVTQLSIDERNYGVVIP